MSRVSNSHNVSVVAQATTVLATAAAGMSSGGWLQMTGGNLPTGLGNFVANPVGSSGTTVGFSTKFAHDPSARRFYFVGSDHGQWDIFHQYDEDTNAWTINPAVPFGVATNHGYEHNIWVGGTVNKFYTRRTSGTTLNRWDGGSTWATRNGPCPASYPSAANGMVWFPTLGANGSVVQFQDDNSGQGLIAGIDPITQVATTYASGATLAGTGTYHNFAHYSPTHDVVWFGGGNGSVKNWKLSSSGVVTALADIPGALGNIGPGNTQCLPVVDPLTGNFIVIKSATVWHDLNPSGSGTWAVRPGSPGAWAQVYDGAQPMWATVACTMFAPYNVIVFVKQYSSSANAQMWLYKP
jgi:hypothetical protein